MLYTDVIGVVAGCKGAHGAKFDLVHGYLRFQLGTCFDKCFGLGSELDKSFFFLQLFHGDFGIAKALFCLLELFFVKKVAL